MTEDGKGWYFYRGNIPCVKEGGQWMVYQKDDQTLRGRRMDVVLCQETDEGIVAKAVSLKGEEEWEICSGWMVPGVTGLEGFEEVSHKQAVMIMFECDRRRKPWTF